LYDAGSLSGVPSPYATAENVIAIHIITIAHK